MDIALTDTGDISAEMLEKLLDDDRRTDVVETSFYNYILSRKEDTDPEVIKVYLHHLSDDEIRDNFYHVFIHSNETALRLFLLDQYMDAQTVAGALNQYLGGHDRIRFGTEPLILLQKLSDVGVMRDLPKIMKFERGQYGWYAENI